MFKLMLDAGSWILDLGGILFWFIQNPASSIQYLLVSSLA
jgi:hypothetical protein